MLYPGMMIVSNISFCRATGKSLFQLKCLSLDVAVAWSRLPEGTQRPFRPYPDEQKSRLASAVLGPSPSLVSWISSSQVRNWCTSRRQHIDIAGVSRGQSLQPTRGRYIILDSMMTVVVLRITAPLHYTKIIGHEC